MDVILIRYQDIDLLRGWQNDTKFFLTKSYVMPEQICLCGGGGNFKNLMSLGNLLTSQPQYAIFN